MLMEAGKASLLIIDMQEQRLTEMPGRDAAIRHCTTLIKAAQALQIPMAVSEHCPKDFGQSVPAIKDETDRAAVFERITFSCWRDEAIKAHLIALHESGRPQIMICGAEAHISVLQTACDLAQAGFAVFAVVDAMLTRKASSMVLAENRMRQDGVVIVDAEMTIYELLGRAGTPVFKELSPLINSR